MRIDQLFSKGKQPISFEIFPPKGDLSLDAARAVASELAALSPAFVSVTCSAGGSGNSEATHAIAGMIEHEFGVTGMAHMTCVSLTAQDFESRVSDLQERGVSNVLALRGDLVEGSELSSDYRHAVDLIPGLVDAGFCVGAAAYPEGHIDCMDLSLDIERMKAKQDAGASFFVSQLFFDNASFYRFREAAARAGITAPITAGVMPFLSKSQIQRMVFMCGVSLPSPIIKLLAKYEQDPESLRRAGIEYACGQLTDLAAQGADGLHIYTMNQPDIARAAAASLFGAKAAGR